VINLPETQHTAYQNFVMQLFVMHHK